MSLPGDPRDISTPTTSPVRLRQIPGLVRELLAIAFDGLGVRRVEARCFVENRASWHIMEKVGMRREQYTVRESLHRDGTWQDGIMYALLADEWREPRVVDGPAQLTSISRRHNGMSWS